MDDTSSDGWAFGALRVVLVDAARLLVALLSRVEGDAAVVLATLDGRLLHDEPIGYGSTDPDRDLAILGRAAVMPSSSAP